MTMDTSRTSTVRSCTLVVILGNSRNLDGHHRLVHAARLLYACWRRTRIESKIKSKGDPENKPKRPAVHGQARTKLSCDWSSEARSLQSQKELEQPQRASSRTQAYFVTAVGQVVPPTMTRVRGTVPHAREPGVSNHLHVSCGQAALDRRSHTRCATARTDGKPPSVG